MTKIIKKATKKQSTVGASSRTKAISRRMGLPARLQLLSLRIDSLSQPTPIIVARKLSILIRESSHAETTLLLALRAQNFNVTANCHGAAGIVNPSAGAAHGSARSSTLIDRKMNDLFPLFTPLGPALITDGVMFG